MAHVEILQRVSEEPGLRINDIAERHRMSKNSVSVVVQQMVVKGLVERISDADDRRAVKVNVTDTGAEILSRWREATNARVDLALAQLSEDQQADIRAALPALLAFVEHLESSEQASLEETDEGAPAAVSEVTPQKSARSR